MAVLPEQIDEGPVIVGDRFEFTVTTTDAVPVQPDAFATVTVYVPAVVTEIVCVALLFDHE